MSAGSRRGSWLARRAENVAAAMLGVMFLAFLAQIFFRYVLNFPIGWTSELTIILWLWVVLWGAAFVVSEEEEIRFDLVSSSAGPGLRRAMGLIAAFAVLVIYAGALPATIDYVQFMKVEKTAYLKIPFDWLYSIYVLFAVAILLRYLRIFWRLLKGDGMNASESDRTP